MERGYDAVVVGAGPSGAAAAKGLSQNGLKVLIIERKRLPRYKICSGLINEKSQKLTERHFGQIPDECFCRPKIIKGVRLWKNPKEHTNWPFGGEKGAPNVWRAQYDKWLVDRSGAEVRDGCLLKNFKVNGTKITIFCEDEREGNIEISCKYLVGAEGCLSSIRAKLNPKLESEALWFLAYQNYYEGESDLDPEWYHGFLAPEMGEIYAWYNVKDNYIIFGTSVKKGERFGPYLATYTEFLKKNFGLKLGKLIKKSSCLGTNLCATGNFYLGSGNVLLVGEAAGFLNMFGEGISSALATGLLAAQAIKESLSSGKNVVEIYTELTHQERRETLASWKLANRIANRRLLLE